MTHSQLSDYFYFLGLDGYGKCHKYHYLDENINYKKLNYYYIHHYNKLIEETPFKNPSVIPSTWYQYSRQDVDKNTRKDAIKTGFNKWVEWEIKTKTLYETMYQELININEIAAAKELSNYIKDVDEELAMAQQKLLELTAIDFNISDIMQEQKALYKKYTKKMRETVCSL